MSTTYPTSKQTIPNPSDTDLLENTDDTLDHDYQHGTVNDTIEALQDKVGVDSSAETTSHDYKLSEVTGSEKALTSGSSSQSVTGLTLVTPTVNLSSNATGDIYYRDSGGSFQRLAIGSNDQILAVQAGLPEWVANPSTSDASTNTKGVVELSTNTEALAKTDTERAITPSNLGAMFLDEDDMASDSDTKMASQQSIKAYVDNKAGGAIGAFTKDMSNTTTTTIAHGLSKVPDMIEISWFYGSGSSAPVVTGNGAYDGINQSCAYIAYTTNGGLNGSNIDTSYAVHYSYGASSLDYNYNQGSISVDSTNITITWSKTNSPTGTASFQWKAI